MLIILWTSIIVTFKYGYLLLMNIYAHVLLYFEFFPAKAVEEFDYISGKNQGMS